MSTGLRIEDSIPPQRRWSHDLCDCCGYQDPTGRGHFFPVFFPMTCFCTCCIVGRIRARLSKERVLCCNMGRHGLCLCLFSCPFVICQPFYCLYFSYSMRREVIQRYSVVKESCTECCALLFCPCSLFQIIMSLDEWEGEIKPQQVPVVVSNPIVKQDSDSSPVTVIAVPIPTIYRVRLPLDLVPGTKTPVELPDGRRLIVEVPKSCRPGGFLDISVS